jgi:hypothetical protein
MTTAVPDETERLARLGWAVFPASQYSRASCFRGARDAATSDLDSALADALQPGQAQS